MKRAFIALCLAIGLASNSFASVTGFNEATSPTGNDLLWLYQPNQNPKDRKITLKNLQTFFVLSNLTYVDNVKHNYGVSSGAPPVTADSSIGYAPGSTWKAADTGYWYVCDDATVGAAVWSRVYTAAEVDAAIDASGSGTVDTTGTVNADEIAVFSDADTLKALTESEFKTAYSLTIGTDVLAPDGDGSSLTGITITETDSVVGAITGIPKADGAGNISAAVAGTDYQAPLEATTDYQLPLEEGVDYVTSANLALTYQPLNANLTEFATTNPSANGLSLISAADYAAMRVLLNIGTSALLNTGNAIGEVVTWEDDGAGNASIALGIFDPDTLAGYKVNRIALFNAPVDGHVPVYNATTARFDFQAVGTSSGGASSIAELTDWPPGVTATEISYLDGVTSGIQEQINGITLNGITGLAPVAGTNYLLYFNGAEWVLAENLEVTAIDVPALTDYYVNGVSLFNTDAPADGQVPVWNAAAGQMVFIGHAGGAAPAIADITDWPAGVVAAEVGYLDGVTSGIQTQIDGKQTSSAVLTNIVAGTGAVTTTGEITGAIKMISKTVATYTVGTDGGAEEYGGVFVNGDNDAIAFTLGTAVKGKNACFEQGQGVTGAITVTPATGDYLVFEGVRGTVATGLSSSGAGKDKLCVRALNDTDWHITTVGTWAE